MCAPERQEVPFWVPTCGFLLLHRNLPDERQEGQQQSEQLLPAGQFLREQSNIVRLPRRTSCLSLRTRSQKRTSEQL